MSEHTTLPETNISPRKLRLAGAIALVFFGAVVVIGVTTRVLNARDLRQWTDEQSIPTVVVQPPEVTSAGAPLELPAQMDAFASAPIYARTSGYVKSWDKDIGAPVKAGELLAVLDTPDLDQQLAQAVADLASARANAALAATTAKRWQDLRKADADSVSQQSVDQYNGDLAAKDALANSAQANVDRLKATKAFARIVSPFDGRVTARNTDIGALVNEGNAGAALFQVSDTSKLRVYVRVPQVYAQQIHRGDVATLTVPEQPGKVFQAKVEADARAIAPTSGTTLVQLLVDNTEGRLLPSSFASVRFKLTTVGEAAGMRVPAEALIFDDKGLRVATLDAQDKVVFKDVTITRDYGKTVELGAGLAANDRVVINPPDGLEAGDQVHVATPAANEAKHAKG